MVTFIHFYNLCASWGLAVLDNYILPMLGYFVNITCDICAGQNTTVLVEKQVPFSNLRNLEVVFIMGRYA